MCLGPWIKVYPALLAVGLLGLRRWRAFAAFAAAGIAVAVLDFHAIQRFLVNQRFLFHYVDDICRLSASAAPWNHPLPNVLAGPLIGGKLGGLAMPLGKAAAAAFILALLAWVAYHVYHCPKRDVLAYPFFLWIVALATFASPVSNDYNLCFLPLAALAIWDRRDPLLVHVALVLMCLWWQPIAMSINGNLVLLLKVLGVMALGVGLVERAREQSPGRMAAGERHVAWRRAAPKPSRDELGGAANQSRTTSGCAPQASPAGRGRRPESMASAACRAHSANDGDRPTVARAAAALAITISRGGPRRP